MKYGLLSLIAVCAFSSLVQAKSSGPIDLFSEKNNDQILTFDLVSNFAQVIRDTRHEFPDRRTLQEADIVHNFNGATKSIRLKIRARGWSRLQECDIPPIKLDFNGKKSSEGTAFEGTKDLKLVNSCFKGRGQAGKRRWAMREYIMYRLYQRVTPISFKVRPAFVTYKNWDGSLVWNDRDFGFLIENTAQMAKRLGMTKYDLPEQVGVHNRTVDQETYLRLYLFQYMMNNTDYGVSSKDLRNIDLIKDASGRLYTVPYDFDQAEFVRTVNYEQNTELIENDKNDICFSWGQVQYALSHFLKIKNAMLGDIEKYRRLKYLTRTEAMHLRWSIIRFYNMIGNGSLRNAVNRTWRKNSCRR